MEIKRLKIFRIKKNSFDYFAPIIVNRKKGNNKMARTFTPKEIQRLETIHPKLRAVIYEAGQIVDFYIVCGFRDKIDQDLAYEKGFSKVRFPNSRHNKSDDPRFGEGTSDAVDLCPFPIDWNDRQKFYKIYNAMISASQKLKIPIRAGADFNQDGNLKNDKFVDLPHFELARVSK